MYKNSDSLLKETETIRCIHYLMGTFVEIEASGKKKSQVVEGVEAAFSEIRRLERILSKYDKESEIARVNETAHIAPLKISAETFTLLEEALNFSRLSEGAFDITVGVVLDLWGLAQKRDFLPMQDELEGACKKVGYAHIVLNPEEGSIFLDKPGVTIDLGGIGKGYAIDKAVEVLRKSGIKKATLDFGGHIHRFNDIDETKEYIGIKNPIATDEVIASIPVNNKSISTSANYERNFNIGGKSYGHIINPASGYPADNGILSVSVVCESAMCSDMLSTAVFVMGLEEGMRLIEDSNNAEAVIITNNNGKTELHSFQKLKEVVSVYN